MKRNLVETVLGGAVLVIAIMFVFFVMRTADVEKITGYEVKAAFLKVGGLNKGSDVRINGIKIGNVTSSVLDLDTYDAVVTMSIDNTVKIPTDSVASIGSLGILGGKYLRLQPGASKTAIAAGGTITNIKDFRSLEDQVGEIIFLATGGDGQTEQ